MHFCLAHLGQEQQFVHYAGHLLRAACDGLQGYLNIRSRHAGMIFEQQIRIDEDVGERCLEIVGDRVGERFEFLVALLELRKVALQRALQPACALQFDSSTRCLYRAPSRKAKPVSTAIV